MNTSLTKRLTRWLPGAPRQVTGPTEHVVVVGAGLAGLSAAMRLAGGGSSGHRARAGGPTRWPGGPTVRSHRRRQPTSSTPAPPC
jgi:NADPH-dependent 2,4-dienoyl-CoA reductase/sulfur reductase-like enzyme